MEISQQDKQTLIANERHMLTAKDGWVQQVYDLEKLHAIYEKYVGHYPLTTWCGACVVKFMQRLAMWWDSEKAANPIHVLKVTSEIVFNDEQSKPKRTRKR